jgi:predicted nuclease of restriction endonuclease-like RecB superfamily
MTETITAAEYRKMLGAKEGKRSRKSKYNTDPKLKSELGWDSKGEYEYYEFLKLREAAGEIRILAQQPTVYLTDARIGYKPDFLIEENGRQVWIDFKGFATTQWKLKRRLWRYYGPGPLEVWAGKDRMSMALVETIIPK